jgi:hypothetical protein
MCTARTPAVNLRMRLAADIHRHHRRFQRPQRSLDMRLHLVEQAHQLSPDERCGFHVIGAATQRAYRTAEVPREGTHAAAGQIG